MTEQITISWGVLSDSLGLECLTRRTATMLIGFGTNLQRCFRSSVTIVPLPLRFSHGQIREAGKLTLVTSANFFSPSALQGSHCLQGPLSPDNLCLNVHSSPCDLWSCEHCEITCDVLLRTQGTTPCPLLYKLPVVKEFTPAVD